MNTREICKPPSIAEKLSLMLVETSILAREVELKLADKLMPISTTPMPTGAAINEVVEEWPELFADLRSSILDINSSLKEIKSAIDRVEL